MDNVTYQILRHRLWTINDEQGMTAARISGSPAIYEAYDFNASLMDAEGKCLLVGVYNTQQGSCLELVVENVLELFSGGIYDGDVFLTNDPWVGAMHMNDTLVVSPIFVGDQLICWTGISMHEMDVGGPVPGSFVVGATDVYGEAPLIPPLKLVERGEFKPEVETLFMRNTRTPQMNKVNLRARLASQHVTRKRILEIVERYGLEVFNDVLTEIKREVRETVARRLKDLPDARLQQVGYLDHDGNNDELYPIKLTMTKQEGRLILDFTGTSEQAPGLINCARSGLFGGVMAAILPMLCYDLPWASGALEDVIEIRSEEGTVNNARYPAALSMSSISATWMTWNLVSVCLGRLFACSEDYQEEVQACWYPGWQGYVLSGLDQEGEPLAAILMDSGAGGGGARATMDGVDTGGYMAAVSVAIANVETNERIYPILELYRRERGDTAGAGKYRGGAGIEFAVIAHDAPIPITEVVFGQCNDYPGAAGLFGGLPGSVQRHLVARDTNVHELLTTGSIPQRLEDLTAREVEVLPAKSFTVLNFDDVHIAFHSGGGGYGDPLERDPELVARDCSKAFVDDVTRHNIYGVVLNDDHSVDQSATELRRDEIRNDRLRNSSQSSHHNDPAVKTNPDPTGYPIGDAFLLVDADGAKTFTCRRCGYVYGPSSESPKTSAASRDIALEEVSKLNAYGRTEDFSIRQHYCPSCGLMIAADVQLRDEPEVSDIHLLHVSS